MLLAVATLILALSVAGLIAIMVGSFHELLTAYFQRVIDRRDSRLRRQRKGSHRAEYWSATAIHDRYSADILDHYKIMADRDHDCGNLCHVAKLIKSHKEERKIKHE